ncbi:MAG: DUF4286 family protein [Flammeovirgaceae bacterium]
MIIYNVTVNVEKDIQEEWIKWMKEVHIPDMLNTGLFEGHKFLRLLNEEPENTGVTYAVQCFCEDMKKLQLYMAQHAPALQKEHTERYKDKFVAFRTLLEEV